jgi:hypothetical protein
MSMEVLSRTASYGRKGSIGMLEIFDPRTGELPETFESGRGLAHEAVAPTCLVVYSSHKSVYRNAGLLREVMRAFPTDRLCVYVALTRLRFLRMSRIRRCLGRTSLTRDGHFVTFDYDHQHIDTIADCFETSAVCEGWIIGGFRREVSDMVENMTFHGWGPLDDFFRNSKWFDYFMIAFLPDYFFELFCLNEDRYDQVIQLFSDFPFSV